MNFIIFFFFVCSMLCFTGQILLSTFTFRLQIFLILGQITIALFSREDYSKHFFNKIMFTRVLCTYTTVNSMYQVIKIHERIVLNNFTSHLNTIELCAIVFSINVFYPLSFQCSSKKIRKLYKVFDII